MFTEIPKDVYTIDDKQAVYMSIKERAGEKCPLSAITKDSGVRQTQARFIIDLLLHWKYIKKVCILDMGPHYRRYTYEICEDKDYNIDLYEDKRYQQGAEKYGAASQELRNKLEGAK